MESTLTQSVDGITQHFQHFHFSLIMITTKGDRINSEDGSAPDLTDMSRGIFGATVGIDRLLKLLDRNNIKASWFVPAHSIESFPDQIGKIRDASHEMYESASPPPPPDWPADC